MGRNQNMYFGDFDPHNVEDYESGFAEIADEIIKRGLDEDILDEDEFEFKNLILSFSMKTTTRPTFAS